MSHFSNVDVERLDGMGASAEAPEWSALGAAEITAEPAAKPVANSAAKMAPNRVPGPAGDARPRGRSRAKLVKRDQRGSHSRRLVSNLLRESIALDMLARRGLDQQTIAAVGLGIREPYTRADGRMVSGVLVYPVASFGERTRYGCLNLDQFTENPEHPVGWSAGKPAAVNYGTGDIALVCASALEAWLAWQSAAAAGVALTAIASTQADAVPAAWTKRRHWAGWTRVIVTDGTSRAQLAAIASAAGRPLERCLSVPPPPSDGMLDHDDLMEWVLSIAERRQDLPVPIISDPDLMLPGDYVAGKVSVHGGTHDGRMYYAFAVERRERSANAPSVVYSYRTLVVRDDGALLEPEILPAPPGTPLAQQVHALSDGTRIAPRLGVSACTSWSLDAIKSFVKRRQASRPYDGPSGIELLERLVGHLVSVVWLPDTESHEQVAAFVMATYFHRVFDAFPILYINGPKGSGKSELTAAVVSVAFNGSLMAQGSAAALVRLAHEGGGLIAIDDAEMLTAGFGDLAQALKVGYKASTALKRLVGASGATEVIDFFGPRVLCNTRGLDEVLMSRCIAIRTEQSPSDLQVGRKSDFQACAWRDAMHDYAMSHVEQMIAIVGERRHLVRNRDDELRLPMEAVKALITTSAD